MDDAYYICRSMRTQHLGDGELTVLKALWDLGTATVRTVREHLTDSGHALAYNTVQTVLSRLVEKRLVGCDKSSTPHQFSALVARDQFRKDRLSEVMSKIYDGAAGAMAVQLVQEARLQPEEIDELQDLLRSLAAGHKRKKGKG